MANKLWFMNQEQNKEIEKHGRQSSSEIIKISQDKTKPEAHVFYMFEHLHPALHLFEHLPLHFACSTRIKTYNMYNQLRNQAGKSHTRTLPKNRIKI